MRRAQRDPNARHSSIYKSGTEYALCSAMAQLMSAVVAVLNESLTESLKGFYKLRKAYLTLDSIIEIEKTYMDAQNISQATRTITDTIIAPDSSDATTNTTVDGINSKELMDKSLTERLNSQDVSSKQELGNNGSDEDDVEDFQDAEEAHDDESELQNYMGKLEIDGEVQTLQDSIHTPSSPQSPLSRRTTSYFDDKQPVSTTQMLSLDPSSEIFDSNIDVFIHSGSNLCYGILLLIISLVPPVFSKLLYVIGFRGNRRRGLRMLWQSSKFRNINGAMAGVVLLAYYNGLAGYCDILPDPDLSLPPQSPENIDGYPTQRLESLLADMRARHPHSKFWLLEEARMHAAKRNLSAGLSILKGDMKSPLKQVHALSVFERALQAMYAHDYPLCASSFQECVGLNNWSHALYIYIAGSAHVEMYRQALSSPDSASAETAASHAEKATSLLQSSRSHTGKKKFMARQLPFDVFVTRKLNKWEARAKERGVPFVDAIGVSPLQEMVFFWNGQKKMDAAQLQASLDVLAWSDDPAKNPQWSHETPGEHALLAILRAYNYRAMGRLEDAKTMLQNEVLSLDSALFKGALKDDWILPTAHYEMGANLWAQKDTEGNVSLAQKELEKAAAWESYTLDTRIGLKVATGLDTLKRWKAANGYTQ